MNRGKYNSILSSLKRDQSLGASDDAAEVNIALLAADIGVTRHARLDLGRGVLDRG
jgi:hypothetical protein